MWNIFYTNKGLRAIDEQDNPKFYLCSRFFTDENYKKFSKLPYDEIVSVDCALFSGTERILLDENTAKTHELVNGQQILRVYCFIDGDDSIILEEIEGFSFCGYDLAEHLEISALTNCGGFDEVFNYSDLNSFGLISNIFTARKIQMELENHYPDEDHAYCLIFAVWRRI